MSIFGNSGTWRTTQNGKIPGGFLGQMLNNLYNGTLFHPPLGGFADLVFEASSKKVVTYDDYKRESKVRYAKHELVNQTTVLEYLGCEPEEISFTMTFSTALGVDPMIEVEKARQLCMDGVADYLILGNMVIGNNLWVIESVSEKAIAWDNCGNIIVGSIDVKMIEYVPTLEET